MANPIGLATRAVFGGLSAARRARIFHPRGDACTALVTIADGDHPLHALAGEHDAIVRRSRGIGLPPPLPDVDGVAIKLLGAHGPDAHQDLLLVSSLPGVGVRHLLVPVAARAEAYSSLVRYRNASGVRFLVGATPDGPNRLVLATATLRAAWVPVGTVELRDELDPEASQRLRYSPWHTGAGVQPIGVLNRLRREAYPASQDGRPDT